jgi:hypothetical protein
MSNQAIQDKLSKNLEIPVSVDNRIEETLLRIKTDGIHESILNRVVNQNSTKKQFSHRLIVTLTATVALVCLAILGYIFLPLQNINIFTYTAYAVELRENGFFELYKFEMTDEYETRSGIAFYVILGDSWEDENTADTKNPIENDVIPFDFLDSEQQQEIVNMILELSEIYKPDLNSIEKPQHDENCKKCAGEIIPFECLSQEVQQQTVDIVLDIILNDRDNLP